VFKSFWPYTRGLVRKALYEKYKRL